MCGKCQPQPSSWESVSQMLAWYGPGQQMFHSANVSSSRESEKKSDNHIQSWTIYLSNEKRAINSIASAFRPPLSDCLCPQLPKKGPSATRPQPSTAHNDAAKRHRCDAPGNSETSCKNGFQCLNLSASKRKFQPFLYYDTMI